MRPSWLLRSFVALLTGTAGSAQCSTVAASLGGHPGTTSVVHTTCMWDADGPGPAPNLLVCGGLFASAGTTASNRIAAFDPATGQWFGFAGGMTSAYAVVQSLAVLPNGDLVAAGHFSLAGGVAVDNIARWNGTTWAPLGSGLTNGPHVTQVRLVVLPNGHLVAAGEFTVAGGVAVNGVALWNGTAWSSLGGPFTAVADIELAPNGDLVAGGNPGLRRWNGTWSLVPGFVGTVDALAVAPNGDVFAAGQQNGGVSRFAGGQVTAIGTPGGGWVQALTVTASGELLAGGNFTSIGGVPASRVARWNGATWSPVGSGIDPAGFPVCLTITEMQPGELAIGGQFLGAGGLGSENLVRWDGSQWRSVGGGANAWVNVVTSLRDGTLVSGGYFTAVGGVVANGIARRVNGTWSRLGTGITGTVFSPGPNVRDVAELPNGDLVVCGSFDQAGGQVVRSVARWNGTTWSPLGSGLSWNGGTGTAFCAVAMPNGDAVVGGVFTHAGGVAAQCIARWNGATWSPVGTFPTDLVRTMVVRPDGTLVASFESQFGGGQGLRSWNGSSWSSIGMDGGQYVSALANLRDGSLVAGGAFTTAGGVPALDVARWNGSAWSAMGAGLADRVLALCELADGDVLAACDAVGIAPRVWRWHAGVWSPVPALTQQPFDENVWSLAARPDGDVVLGGSFQRMGAEVAARLAALQPTCRATVAVVPTACSRPAGPLVLTSTALPWVGGAAASRAETFAGGALVVAVLGVSAAQVPLSLYHPSAGASCDVRASTEVLDLVPVTAGAATATLPVPLAASLVGVMVHHQMVEVVLDPSGIAGLYATNGLVWTIGML